MSDLNTTPEAYEPPAITDIASVHELTLNRSKVKRRHHALDVKGQHANNVTTS